MTDTWNAKLYSQFLDLRTRPARDLLAAIPDYVQPKHIYDLGCGPGNSTIILKDRWPEAEIIGIDSSKDMLKEAQMNYPNIHFMACDIAHFEPTQKIDCLFANASLQWLPTHEVLIPKLLTYLNVGGVFAFQMPNNFHSPSHQVTFELLSNQAAWQPLLKQLRYAALTEPLYNSMKYYDLLTQAGTHSVQLWETEYFQEMSGYSSIFDWVQGTGLRTVLSAMTETEQTQFKQAYIAAIAKRYPAQKNGKVLLPFRRIFMVGFK